MAEAKRARAEGGFLAVQLDIVVTGRVVFDADGIDA